MKGRRLSTHKKKLPVWSLLLKLLLCWEFKDNALCDIKTRTVCLNARPLRTKTESLIGFLRHAGKQRANQFGGIEGRSVPAPAQYGLTRGGGRCGRTPDPRCPRRSRGPWPADSLVETDSGCSWPRAAGELQSGSRCTSTSGGGGRRGEQEQKEEIERGAEMKSKR